MVEYIDKKEAVRIVEFYGLQNGSALGRHSGIADMIARSIEALPLADIAPAQRWIPVTERLPNIGQRVVIYHMRKGLRMFDVASYFPECSPWKLNSVFLWMPLPELPVIQEECE